MSTVQEVFDLSRFQRRCAWDKVIEATKYMESFCSNLEDAQTGDSVKFEGLLVDNIGLDHKKRLELKVIGFTNEDVRKFILSKERGQSPAPIVRGVDIGRKFLRVNNILLDGYLTKGQGVSIYGNLETPLTGGSEAFIDLFAIRYSCCNSWYGHIYTPRFTLQQRFEE